MLLRIARPLTEHERAELEGHFRDGFSANWAASRCGISQQTVLKYYHRFRRDGVPRGAFMRKPRPRLERNRPRFYGASTYDGPIWIGEPAETQSTKKAAGKIP